MPPLLLIDFRHDKINIPPFDSLESFEWISGTKLLRLVHLQSVILSDHALSGLSSKMCVWLACRRLGAFCHFMGPFLIPMECEYSVGIALS